MGSYQDGSALIRTRLEATWPSLRPTVPIELPNSTQKVGGGTFVKPTAAPWARFTIQSQMPTETMAAGDNSPERAFDQLQLEVFVPAGQGSAIAFQIGDDFASIWRNHPIPGITFFPTQLIEVGRPAEDPAWWKVDALTPFEREYLVPLDVE
jgi:hypothetical protein